MLEFFEEVGEEEVELWWLHLGGFFRHRVVLGVEFAFVDLFDVKNLEDVHVQLTATTTSTATITTTTTILQHFPHVRRKY